MSISISGESKNKFSIKKGKTASKEKNMSLFNFFQINTKPSNLNNNKNNIFNSSTTYYTTSQKSQRRNFFRVITPSLNNNNINKKNEVLKNKPNKNNKKLNDNDISNDNSNDNNNNNDNISISSEGSSLGLTEIPPTEPKKLSEKEKKEKLLLYFKGKKIYIEIFNGKENASSVFLEILLQYKIIQCKRLCKNIDYIIFKEGHLKTKKYAVMNNIKMVNPLWVDDKINRNIFKDDKEYFVETNMGDILVQEKLGKNNNSEKNYENELEAEFDVEYANMIDKQRENKSKEENNIKQKFIGREKRKNKNTKNKNEIMFLSDNDHVHKYEKDNEHDNKNMVIEDFLETNNSTKNLINNDNKNEINNESIKDEIKENENNSKVINNIPQSKRSNPFKIEKMFTIDNLNDNNNINDNINKNNINDNLNNKNVQKTRSKTPDKIKQRKKRKTKSKDYKHKATSKKIMVTKVQELCEQNQLETINETNNLSQNNIKDNTNDLNKENHNINSNFTPIKNKINNSNDISDLLNKDKDNSDKNINSKNSTLGQKINIITYKLEEKEIQCLKTMNKFEYKGDLKNTLTDYGAIYSSASVIILDKDKSKYDWKMYEFFVDKKILVDLASFLFEFITEKTNEDIIDAQNTLNIINKISINEESYFLNKKIRYQRRSLLHSYNIVENISDHKKDKEENENKKIFNFVIHKNITGGEKRILHKLIKVFLKANIIKVDFSKTKRSHSVGPGIKFQLTTESIFSDRKENIFLIEKISKNNNNEDNIEEKENDKNENIEEEEDEITNEDKNENNEIKGDTYLISKEKIFSRGLYKIIPNFKEVISYKYVFDSFWAGELINLNDNNILKKYSFE